MSRSVAVGQAINLDVQYKDANGASINADSAPSIQITDSQGNIRLDLTTTNVASVGTGQYRYTYIVPSGAPSGTWNDVWVAEIGGTSLTGNFTFSVVSGGTVETIDDADLGDSPSLSWTQNEIDNINYLLDILKKRLKSTGTRYQRDQYGAIMYDGYGDALTEECNVFSDSELITFLYASLSEFNQTPHFTNFYFSDVEFGHRGRYADVIVEGAYILALAAQALIEKGREFNITDNGVSFQPPTISDVLNSELSTFLTSYREKLKFIKTQMKPRPIGMGTMTGLWAGRNPRVMAARHLRARQIF